MRNYDNRDNDREIKAVRIKQKRIIILLSAILLVLCIIAGTKWKNQRKIIEINSLQNITGISDRSTPQNAAATEQISETPNVQQPTATPTQEKSIIMINEMLRGSTTTLNINMEVEMHEGEQYGIYETTPCDIDVEKSLNYLLPNYDYSKLTHSYDQEKFQHWRHVTPPDNYRETVLKFFNRETNWSVSYDIYNVTMTFGYEPNAREVIPEAPGYLVRREQEFNIADPDKLKQAEELAYDLYSTIFGDSFTEYFYQSYSGLKKTIPLPDDMVNPDEVYLVVFSRDIEELPILFDNRTVKMGYYTDPAIDELEVWVVDGKIIHTIGTIRDLHLINKADIISAEQALEIAKAKFETVEETGVFDITRFELMYYPTFTDNAETTDNYAEEVGGAYVKYIPVWVIASGVRMKDVHEYVLIIDAVTGEIIERRKA